jgi:hypothetical protein
MGDESGGLAVLGRNIDLLVDHGRFNSVFWVDRSVRLQGNKGLTRRTDITLAPNGTLESSP